jgi:hypothetical protein
MPISRSLPWMTAWCCISTSVPPTRWARAVVAAPGVGRRDRPRRGQQSADRGDLPPPRRHPSTSSACATGSCRPRAQTDITYGDCFGAGPDRQAFTIGLRRSRRHSSSDAGVQVTPGRRPLPSRDTGITRIPGQNREGPADSQPRHEIRRFRCRAATSPSSGSPSNRLACLPAYVLGLAVGAQPLHLVKLGSLEACSP